MNILIFDDNELEILYTAMNKLQMFFHPTYLPEGKIDYQTITNLEASNKEIMILVDNNLASPICEIARNGFLKDTDRMVKVAAFVVWAKTIGARISCGFSLFETDSQKLSCYTAESQRMQFLYAVDSIPANIWKALTFGDIKSVPKQYVLSNFKTNERKFEYNESVLYLSTEAAVIKIVELLRNQSLKAIDKFIEFSNWYADHLFIADSIMFYAAAVFSNEPNVAMPKNNRSDDFNKVKKGIRNQAWDLTYLIEWSTFYYNEYDSKCFMFATDDITQKIIIINTTPPGKCYTKYF